MASTEDFGVRLERVEQRLAEMDGVMRRPDTDGGTGIDARISPRGWLAVTGPVFAALALGFGVLWSSQQTNTSRMLELHTATTTHLMELTRTTARLGATTERLEGAIDRLDGSVQELRDEVRRLSDRVDRVEG